jgi:hypothetical protein
MVSEIKILTFNSIDTGHVEAQAAPWSLTVPKFVKNAS